MRVLYFDCFAGASGDMILGALLDAGLPLDELRAALGGLALERYEIRVDRVLRAGVSASKFRLLEGSGSPAPESSPNGPPIVHAHDPGARDHTHGPEHVHRQPHVHDETPGGGEGRDERHDHEHDTVRPPVLPPRSHHHHHHHQQHGHHEGEHSHRSVAEIVTLIERSALSAPARARAVSLVNRLAQAEAAIHDMPVSRVHLHEVGALDSIIDIVGGVFAIEWFGADRIVASRLNVGSGTVRCAHGVFPVPAPATVRLLGSAPVYSSGVEAELTTPTGALLVTGFAESYGPVPAMRIDRIGYGAGDRDLPDTPNVLRVLIGEADQPDTGGDQVVVLQCEIDDMNPQIFGVLMDRLLEHGALDVFYAPVQMKKNRPGTLVTVLARPADREAVTAVLFRETTTIGVRYHDARRDCLERRIVTVETPLGAVRFKVSRRDGRVLNASPEFDDLDRLSRTHGLALKEVQAAAFKAYLERPPD